MDYSYDPDEDDFYLAQQCAMEEVTSQARSVHRVMAHFNSPVSRQQGGMVTWPKQQGGALIQA